MRPYWIGVDTGGTFTDLVLVDMKTGDYCHHKVPTSRPDPSEGILQGIAEIVDLAGGKPAGVSFLVHGTTLATNAVLEKKYAQTGMLATAGFRDVLELARQKRPSFYNLDMLKPVPPSPRELRFEIGERLSEKGDVLRPLLREEVVEAAKALRSSGVQAVAICFIHSYANPRHEAEAKEVLLQEWPEAYVCTSTEVSAEFREFERFSSVTINASLMPVIDRYLERFEQGVRQLGVGGRPLIMQSNGGAVTPASVRKLPINTFFSGPAGGVIAATGLSDNLGGANLITFDMGGTSTDVCLIRNGMPARKNQSDIGGFPVRSRSLDIHTIGAGGGSIAWIDPGGLLKVGPISAGSHPGPAAYGRGGDLPTVTDANILLGRLNPEAILGGRMKVYPELAEQVVGRLAGELGVDVGKAASGILDIVNVNMMGAVRVISVEQGEDPRNFTLVPFGGAGPLHGADVAQVMRMRKVIIPPRPGTMSALGLLRADVRGDFSVTRLVDAVEENLPALTDGIVALRREAELWLEEEGIAPDAADFEFTFDMRYQGQNFEIGVEVPAADFDTQALHRVVDEFHRQHKVLYGYNLPRRMAEIVTLRLSVLSRRETPRTERPSSGGHGIEKAMIARRRVWFAETDFIDTPILDRDLLPVGTRFMGPAIVEQMDATSVVPPRSEVVVDDFGNLILTLAE